MLELVNSFLSWRMKKRYHQIELFMKYPHEVQRELLLENLRKASQTEWGKKFRFSEVKDPETFRQRLPLIDYETIETKVKRLRQGEKDLLWPGEIKWFAKSSGTTSSKSKFIPVSPESIEDCHFKGGKDMLSIYCNLYPDTKIFTGSNLRLGGSTFTNKRANRSYYGDVSAILIENMPFWVEMRSTPNNKISLMTEWEEKIEAIANTSMKEDVTSLAGVPSWMLVLLNRIREKSGKENLHEIWPNLELYMHGGVSFAPYRQQYMDLMGRPINYLETYNASEGFFGIQDQKGGDDMLLMLDYGIYYEFIPMERFDGLNSPTLTLAEVETGVNYALVISTNGGLWRYLLGDTIRFTETHPYRFRITGRTKHYINVFGEELIIENAETALARACEQHAARVEEFTVAPLYMQNGESGAHEWLIEFETAPSDYQAFARSLDKELQCVNSDYEAKRYKDMALKPLQLNIARRQLFYDWLKGRNKLGGQNKIPRLSNTRDYLDELLKLNQ